MNTISTAMATGGIMKIGDLVTLSAAGNNQDQNMLVWHATFGMITKIRDDSYRGKDFNTTYGCKKPLIEVQWFFSPRRISTIESSTIGDTRSKNSRPNLNNKLFQLFS